MKKLANIAVIAIIISVFQFGCSSGDKQASVSIKTKQDSISYIIGTSIGNNFKQQNIDINSEALRQGIDDMVKDGKSKVDDATAKKIMANFQREMMSKQDSKSKEDFAKNKAEGDKFLAENKTKDGIVTLPDGLQYKIIKKGSGPMPKATDKVKVNYEGTLINGTVFDSSTKTGKPAEFQVNQVIKGWVEALQMMPVGSTWQLFIPQDLGYGDRANQNIPAGSTLIFKVDLLSIEK